MNKKEVQFVDTVGEYYRRNGRHKLPWRKTCNPYRILVSEVMLQQTQVERVIPKYRAFITKFPTLEKLAHAPLSEVLKSWQGLGYNRRAKMLKACAQKIVTEHNSVFPKTQEALRLLPGVGPYTSGAILAFAYNKPTVLIETNVRTVYLHHFFKNRINVADAEILKYVAKTADLKNSRAWYYALMDYGSYLKKQFGNQNTRSKHYSTQSAFKGSDRQIRGAIVRALSKKPQRLRNLHSELASFELVRIRTQIEALLSEKMIEKKNALYQLSS